MTVILTPAWAVRYMKGAFNRASSLREGRVEGEMYTEGDDETATSVELLSVGINYIRKPLR